MTRILFSVCLVIAACAPLLLLVVDLTQRYSPGTALIDIDRVDTALLICALLVPLWVLPRLGVAWRAKADES